MYHQPRVTLRVMRTFGKPPLSSQAVAVQLPPGIHSAALFIKYSQLRRKFHDTALRHTTTTTHNASVDPSEVSHFTQLAASWWDPHGPSRLLHLMNPLRHEFIARCKASAPLMLPKKRGLKYLDIGCGGGIFTESVARLPSTAHAIGLDPTPAVLSIAKAHALKDPFLASKLAYVQGDIESLSAMPQEAAKYDTISMFEVLEHVSSPTQFLELAKPLLKPGGWLVGSTIARTWTSWMTTKLVAEDLLRIVPRGTHEWDKYINEDELRNYFTRKPGWEDIIIMGVVYVPGLGWKEIPGSEKVGNYFFGVRKSPTALEG